ncbi:hypothetical protein UFOVP328_246 [uncultured Caudovirales phage]|uniref:Uncharacterized protein n=1 Tax=uncultured Caudovirales phage TaxID=2100421 RepID=A0A6J5LY49_9CAUD|nr:hypothetical protein UFOVP328_246 [uncultured Caudovirales phage]
MALENEELQRAMEELREAMGLLADATGDAANNTRKLTEAEKQFKKKLDMTMQGLGGVAKFGAAVGKGETDLKAFNGVIDTATGMVGSLAKAIPVFGEAIAGVAKGLGEAAKMAVDALDNTAKSFVEIGKVGGLTAKGMSGVREQFIRSGLSLQSFQKQVVENSQTLAKFRGLTGEGANEFASIVGNLTQGTDDSLRRMGFNAEEMAQSTGAYLTQQTRLGRSQQMTQQQLTSGTIQYAKELDELTKVTGLSRDAIQKQQDAALSESRFRANYETLMSQGREKEAKALMAFQSQMQSIGPELGQGARDLASGAANTDAARKLMASTGGAAQDIIEQIKSGNIDQYEAAKQLQAASRSTGDAARDNARFVDRANSAFIDFAQQADLNNAQLIEGRGLVKKVQDEQAKGGDKMTDATVSAQKNLEKMSQELNKLGFTLLPQAAVVVEKFSSVMTQAIKGVNKALGIGGGEAGKPTSAYDANRQAQAAAKASGSGWLGQQWAGIKAGAAHTFGISSGAPSGGASAPGGASMSGLRIKSPEAYSGGDTSSQLIEAAKQIQEKLGSNLLHFSAFNDSYHRGPNSLHSKGRALDFTIADPSTSADVANMVKGIPGISKVIDEYTNPSAHATGKHIHAEISARNGFNGVLSGPSSGYRPNLTMHGTEQISIQPNPNTGSVSPNSDSGIMQAQLAKLEELVTVMKSQVSISSKLLSYSS